MKLLDISAGDGKNIIVKNVSLDIKKGEVISLIGPNGGGKSTFLKTISGRLKPLGGSVMIDEKDLYKIPLKSRSKILAIVTTDRVKPEHMTGLDIVSAGRLPYTGGFGELSQKDHEAVERAMDLMNVEPLKDKDFNSLSDGQKQRILIARAICQEPRYLLMDEPTSYLDIRYRMELMDTVKELSYQGVTVIMSLHEPELALRVSDRILLINEEGRASVKTPGEVINEGLIRELYGMSEEMYERVRGTLAKDLKRRLYE